MSLVMFCLVPWGVSGLPTSYSPHLADPIRDDQSLIHPLVQYRKKREIKLDWIFIYLDDYIPLIRAPDWLLQTTNQIRRFILAICKDTSTFLTYGLFEIIHLHSSCLPIQYSVLGGLGCLVL